MGLKNLVFRRSQVLLLLLVLGHTLTITGIKCWPGINPAQYWMREWECNSWIIKWEIRWDGLCGLLEPILWLYSHFFRIIEIEVFTEIAFIPVSAFILPWGLMPLGRNLKACDWTWDPFSRGKTLLTWPFYTQEKKIEKKVARNSNMAQTTLQVERKGMRRFH